MKKSLMISTIFFLNLVSAKTLSDYLSEIAPSTIIIISTFLIAFTLISFSLKRIFKGEEQKNAYIIALIVALLTAYGINTLKFYWIQEIKYKISSFFSEINLGTGITIGVVIVFLIILFYELKSKKN